MAYLLDEFGGRGVRERNQDKSKNKAERMEEAYDELPLTCVPAEE